MDNRQCLIKEKKMSKSRVQQNFKKDADINNIVKKYKSGQIDQVNPAQLMYRDVSGIPTFHEMLNIVTEANANFLRIDPEIRQEFENKPEKLVEFMSDPKNQERALELGLIKKADEFEPLEVVVKNDAGEMNSKSTQNLENGGSPTPEGNA